MENNPLADPTSVGFSSCYEATRSVLDAWVFPAAHGWKYQRHRNDDGDFVAASFSLWEGSLAGFYMARWCEEADLEVGCFCHYCPESSTLEALVGRDSALRARLDGGEEWEWDRLCFVSEYAPTFEAISLRLALYRDCFQPYLDQIMPRRLWGRDGAAGSQRRGDAGDFLLPDL